jgi:hypothetical protein
MTRVFESRRLLLGYAFIALALPLRARAEVAARGIEFQVNTYTSDSQSGQSVSSSAEGDFVVVWQSRQDGDGFGVFARRFSSSGIPLTSELQIHHHCQSAGQSHGGRRGQR